VEFIGAVTPSRKISMFQGSILPPSSDGKGKR